MTGSQELVIEPLSSNHNRQAFACGVESLDRYLRRQAKQDVKRKVSRVFIATLPSEPDTIVGYYTLSALSLELADLPEEKARRLPRHPVPAALIGRLACSVQAQGKGIGKLLLVDAIKRTLAVSDQLAIYALVVDVIDERAVGFYRQYGFIRLSDESRRMFLPLKSWMEK